MKAFSLLKLGLSAFVLLGLLACTAEDEMLNQINEDVEHLDDQELDDDSPFVFKDEDDLGTNEQLNDIEIGDDYIAFEHMSLWGIKDTDGQIVIPPTFSNIAYNPISKKIEIKKNQLLWQLDIDTLTLKLAPQFRQVNIGAGSEIAAVQLDNLTWRYLNLTSYAFLSEQSYQAASIFTQDTAVITDKQSQHIFSIESPDNQLFDFGSSEEFKVTCCFRKGDNYFKIEELSSGLKGLVTPNGETLLDIKFQSIQVLGGSLIVAAVSDIETSSLKFNLYNNAFDLLHENLDSKPKKVGANLWVYQQNGLQGVLNNDGSILLNANYQNIKLSPQSSFMVRQNELWGLLSESGEVILTPEYEDLWHFADQDIISIKKDGLWGAMMVEDLSITISPIYDNFLNFSENLAAISVDGKWGFIDRSGDITITPQFSKNVEDGSIVVEKTQEEIIDTPPVSFPKSIAVPRFSNGFANVPFGDEYGFVDLDGNFTDVDGASSVLSINDNLAAFRQGQLWGYADTSGQIVIEAQFTSASSFNQKLARVTTEDETQLIVHQSGQVFENISEAVDNLSLAKLHKSEWVLIDENFQVIQTFDSKIEQMSYYDGQYIAAKIGGLWTFVKPSGEALSVSF